MAEGSNPFTPISYTYWQLCTFILWNTGKRTGKLLWTRVEKGETIGVENENGDRAVMTFQRMMNSYAYTLTTQEAS